MREIRCIGCGIYNRIPRYSIYRVPRCAACKTLLPEPKSITTARTVYIHRGRILLALGVAAGIGLAFVPGLLRPIPPPVTKPPSDFVKATPQPPLDFSKEARTPAPAQDACAGHAQPESRLYALYFNGTRPTAPLTIVSSDTGESHFVVLEDADSGIPVASYFVRAGETMKAAAPLGTFILRYATGKSWCGADQLFGPDTDTGELDIEGTETPKPLQFYDTGYSLRGKTIWLSGQPTGDLKPRAIPRSQFWHG